MKKFSIIGVSLFAVLAFSAFAVASAFAEPPLWLVNGVEATAGTSVETTGSLTLTDLKTLVGAATVDCKGAFDGTVGTEGKDEITELLNAAGEKISSTPLTGLGLSCTILSVCETARGATVWPVGLPWKTQLELSGTEVLDNAISEVGPKVLGYELECFVIGTKTIDECTQALGASLIENMLNGAENDLLGIFNEVGTGNCTQGGAGSGDLEGEGLLQTLNGQSLIVSGDGVTE